MRVFDYELLEIVVRCYYIGMVALREFHIHWKNCTQVFIICEWMVLIFTLPYSLREDYIIKL